jgi:phosphoribosyl 1,2-cyclic phosphate phosphodiesterase
MTEFRLTIMGCGHSSGVPAAGNHWGACDPQEKRNKRLRPSIAVQTSATALIVDTGPDFREQVNAANIQSIDAVLYTHAHSDHVNGIDDLRSFRFRGKKRVPVYAMAETMEELHQRFGYIFKDDDSGIYPALASSNLLDDTKMNQLNQIGDISFIPFLQDHGLCQSLGFRFGSIGYSTDMKDLDEHSLNTLRGVDVWIADAAAHHMSEYSVHATIEKVYALNERIGAKQVYLTHLTPAMDYQALCRELRSGYLPAYDGLELLGEFAGELVDA